MYVCMYVCMSVYVYMYVLEVPEVYESDFVQGVRLHMYVCVS